MRYNELFTPINGVMTQVFKPDFPELYAKCFGAIESTSLDSWAYMKYGGREMLGTVTNDTYKDFINGVIAINADKWTNVVNLLGKQYDCLNPTVKTVTTTKTATAATTDANENINAQKTFNDEQFSDGQRNQTNGTSNRQDDESATSSENGVGFGTLNSVVIQKEKELRESEYRHTIIAEILDEITLKIYN